MQKNKYTQIRDKNTEQCNDRTQRSYKQVATEPREVISDAIQFILQMYVQEAFSPQI